MQITAISIGLVKWNEPTLNSGLKSKLCSPGEGKPQPLNRWHPPLASTPTSPVTGHLLPGRPRRRSLPAVAVNDVADRDRHADQHAGREEQRDMNGPADQPADAAVRKHPADLQSLRHLVCRLLL